MSVTITDSTNNPETVASGATVAAFAAIDINDPVVSLAVPGLPRTYIPDGTALRV